VLSSQSQRPDVGVKVGDACERVEIEVFQFVIETVACVGALCIRSLVLSGGFGVSGSLALYCGVPRCDVWIPGGFLRRFRGHA
jgi:hypothetical protein